MGEAGGGSLDVDGEEATGGGRCVWVGWGGVEVDGELWVDFVGGVWRVRIGDEIGGRLRRRGWAGARAGVSGGRGLVHCKGEGRVDA